MYRFLLTFILCAMFYDLRANELSVTAKIIDTGIDSRGNQICRVQAEVKNLSEREITVAMMTCGWDDSWVVTPETVFSIPIIPCDSNFPASYTFPSGGGFIFRFQISALASAGKIEDRKVKVGFRFIKVTAEQMREKMLHDIYEKFGRKFPVIWSSEMAVPKIESKALEREAERTEAAKLPIPEEPAGKFGQTLRNFATSGRADGRSFATAVALEAKTQAQGVAAQHAWIEKNLPGAHLAPSLNPNSDEGIVSFGQEVTEHNGKLYSVLHLQMPDGNPRDVYFDISGYVGK